MEAANQLRMFIQEHRIIVLNVAGPRESEEPGVGVFVKVILTAAFEPDVK